MVPVTLDSIFSLYILCCCTVVSKRLTMISTADMTSVFLVAMVAIVGIAVTSQWSASSEISFSAMKAIVIIAAMILVDTIALKCVVYKAAVRGINMTKYAIKGGK